MSDQAEDVNLLTHQEVSEAPKEEDVPSAPHCRQDMTDEF